MKGTIVKGIGGFYYVQTEKGVMECRARGVFRKEGIRPLCGDLCEAEPENEECTRGWITRILPRRNAMIRPAAANADQAVLIFAITRPDADTGVIDRLLVNMEAQQIPVRIVFTKKDLDREGRGERLKKIYENAGYPVYLTSVKKTDSDGKTGESPNPGENPEKKKCEGLKKTEPGKMEEIESEGLEEVMDALRGRTSILCGPSGAGKSTLTRTLFPFLPAESGELSQKIGRGKNTTRASELYFAGEGTAIMDTPGFTSVELLPESEDELEQLFPEFRPWLGKCRFRGCRHRSEPDCRVRLALEEGMIPPERYKSYEDFYLLIQDRRKRS